MVKILTPIITLLQISIPITYAAAVAAPGVIVHDVTPGPGMPSLESLGVTSAQLYEEIPSSRHKLMKRFDNFCGGGRGFTANVDDVIACFNYLERLGHTDCGVPAGNNGVEFCFAGTAGINGVSFNGPATSSYCSDVALGVQWVFTNCNNGGQVEGSAAAYGNGNLIVVVGKRD